MPQTTGVPFAQDYWLQLPSDIADPSYAKKVRLFAQTISQQMNIVRGTYSSTPEFLVRPAGGAAGQALISGGSGAPTWLTATQGAVLWGSGTNGTVGSTAVGTSGQALVSGGTGTPTWFNPSPGAVVYAGAGGILAETAVASYSGRALISGATNAPTWWNPSAGTFAYIGANGVLAASTVGTSGQVLTSGGTGAPSWISAVSTDTVDTLVKRDNTGDFTTRRVILSGAAVSQTDNGGIYYDATKKTETFRMGGVASRRVGAIAVQTSQGSVSDTASETSMLTVAAADRTLPVGFWTVGRVLRVTMVGLISTRAAFAETLRLDLESDINGTIQAVQPLALIAAMVGQPYIMEVLLTCRSLGATGSIFSVVRFMLPTAASTVDINLMDATLDAGWDTTQAEILDFKATWSTGDVDNIATCDQFILEVLS